MKMSFSKYTTNAKTFTREDKDFEKLEKKLMMGTQLLDAVTRKIWADYLSKMAVLLAKCRLLKQYVEYIAGKRMHALGQEKI